MPPTWPTFGKDGSSLPSQPSMSRDKHRVKSSRSPGGGGSPRSSSPVSRGAEAPPRVPDRKDSLTRDLPAELQGVSVKDLVKALGMNTACCLDV